MSTSEYNEIRSEVTTIETATSDLMEEIYALSLPRETEENLVAFCDTIKSSVEQISSSASDLDDFAEQERECSGDDGPSFPNTIETGLGDLNWGADNLLDQQVMEALGELIVKHGSLKTLQFLQKLD